MSPVSPASALKQVFGPDRWATRAARALGITERMAQYIGKGQFPLQRRYIVIIQNIARDRRGNANKELARRQAALARETEAWLKEAAAADLVFRHLLAEDSRQGRTKRGRHNL